MHIIIRKKSIIKALAGFFIIAALIFVTMFALDKPVWDDGGSFSKALLAQSANAPMYRMNLDLDPQNHRLQGKLVCYFASPAQPTTSTLSFHLYPNAFALPSTAPFTKDEMKQAYPKGFDAGKISVSNVKVDGKTVNTSIGGKDQTTLLCKLEKVVAYGQKVTVTMDFSVQIPACFGRFGYGPSGINLCQFYPQLSMWDKTGWRMDEYDEIGDPFYADCANYEVDLTAPQNSVVASGGIIEKVVAPKGKGKWHIALPMARDFALFISPDYRVSLDKVGDTTIYSYYHHARGGKEALRMAKKALQDYNARYGSYPYPRFSVVESDFFIGGMEYTGVVQVDKTLYQDQEDTKDWLDFVVMHEVGHQWFYQMVGNDEIKTPWLDEALTEYTSLQVFMRDRGKIKGATFWQEVVDGQINNMFLLGAGKMKPEDLRGDLPITSYPDNMIYSVLVYSKGAKMYQQICDKIGEKAFDRAIQDYVSRCAFGFGSQEVLLQCFQRASGQNVADILNQGLGRTP